MYGARASAIIVDVSGLHRIAHAGFSRPREGRVVAGVSGAIGDPLGLDTNVVRCGFVVLSLAFGFGLLCYGAAWALLPPRADDAPLPIRRTEPDVIATLAFAAVVLGLLFVARAIGLWPGGVVVWPIAAVFVGLALLAMHGGLAGEDDDLPSWPWLERLPAQVADALTALFGTRRGALARAIAGGICVVAGLLTLTVTVDSWGALRGALAAMFAVVIGIALVVGPAVMRLANDLVGERRERIRADERAEMAAHLHDSVLQTLALVQRKADDPREVVRLARVQERELRSWLLDGGARRSEDAGSLGTALEDLAAAVETEHGIPIEVVRVRDCAADGLEPMLLAAREAILNATRHSGAASVAVYIEVEPERVTIFVRDRGKGFDPDEIPADRGGITNSIVGRMTRAGGTACVRSEPGEGTEVELSMERAS
jgi:signal transduction histidine kinase/phage shock protein PspC (stress-responsive transcriptional regulator)